MKKFKVLTILLFALIILNVVISKSALLLPINNNFAEYFIKRALTTCRIEPKSDLKEMPVINVGDAQVGTHHTTADISVMTEYSGCSMLWLKLTAKNRHDLKDMMIIYWSASVAVFIVSVIICIYIFVLSCMVLWGFAKDKIFNYKQSKRIGTIVFLLILSDVLNNAYTLGIHYYTASKVTLADWNFVMPNLYISGIITAIILWLFNEMLKHTILLKEEQSLTI